MGSQRRLASPPLLQRLHGRNPNIKSRDGTQVQFKSITQSKYLTAEDGGGSTIVANRASASGWETFRLWRISKTTFQLLVFNGNFISLNIQGSLAATANSPGIEETFEIVRNPDDRVQVCIRAPNGNFLQAKADGSVTADFSESIGWEDGDLSVFIMTIVSTMRGEFQVTNGYSPDVAATVMIEHWNSYIVEEDFFFMSQNGINTVRIPVGWWIALSNPPLPYVVGSLQALDRAFQWAEKYRLKVIVDLHAAPGAQNGYEHSGSRDGSQEWGDNYIQQTVAVIRFLAARYARRPSLLAVELLNEPLAPGVGLDTLRRYYLASYYTIHRYTSHAYVIMSNRLGLHDQTELLNFASGFPGSIIDVHYYNLFEDKFMGLTVEQNINYVSHERSADLSALMVPNGPPIFVGEWSAEWDVTDASKEDYRRFARAQLQVYGRATFGWAYWSYKNVDNHWSLRWMIENGYISLE